MKLQGKIVALLMVLVLVCAFAGCSGTVGENPTESPADSFEAGDYVELGDYEGIEIKADGLDLYVGDVVVDVPYRDEGFGTDWTLQFYYSQVNPSEEEANRVIPADEEVAQLGIPGVTSYFELKDYVVDKVNKNDEITSFILIGDAIMEQVVANSRFDEIPENVLLFCEEIYSDYLEKMLAHYNEIGVIPTMQKDENSARKVLAAMAIAKEVGIGTDAFDYEEVLKYLVG